MIRSTKVRSLSVLCAACFLASVLLSSCVPAVDGPKDASSWGSSATAFQGSSEQGAFSSGGREYEGTSAPSVSADDSQYASQTSRQSSPHSSQSRGEFSAGTSSSRSSSKGTGDGAKPSSKPAGTSSKGGGGTAAKPPAQRPISVKTPKASGSVVLGKGGTSIDASNSAEGYIMVKHTGSSKRLKLQIKKDGKTYSYDLNNKGNYEVFPLTMGSGSYSVMVAENIAGTKYSVLYNTTISVKLKDALTTYLYPSQYVWFTASSKAVKKSYELCAGKNTELEMVQAVYSYIIQNIKYDKKKAATVTSGYLPDADETLSSGKGICFDYAALLAVMLRAQGIPTKLVKGKVAPNDISHAWNMVYVKEKGWIKVGFTFQAKTWTRMDPTFSASPSGLTDFIGNGKNYTGLYEY